MATFWTGVVSTQNGSSNVTVDSGDDINLINERSALQVETNQVVEVVRAYGSTIELAENWPGSTAGGRAAIAVPTAGNLAEASERLRTLGDQATAIINNALTEEVNDLTAAVVWADVPDANITESSVLQHTGGYVTISSSQTISGKKTLSDTLHAYGQTGSTTSAAAIIVGNDDSSQGSVTDAVNKRFVLSANQYNNADGTVGLISYLSGASGSSCNIGIVLDTDLTLNASSEFARIRIGGSTVLNISPSNAVMSVPVNLPEFTVAGLPAGSERDIVYCSNGDAGSPCLAVKDGASWKRIPLGATVSDT